MQELLYSSFHAERKKQICVSESKAEKKQICVSESKGKIYNLFIRKKKTAKGGSKYVTCSVKKKKKNFRLHISFWQKPEWGKDQGSVGCWNVISKKKKKSQQSDGPTKKAILKLAK